MSEHTQDDERREASFENSYDHWAEAVRVFICEETGMDYTSLDIEREFTGDEWLDWADRYNKARTGT